MTYWHAGTTLDVSQSKAIGIDLGTTDSYVWYQLVPGLISPPLFNRVAHPIVLLCAINANARTVVGTEKYRTMYSRSPKSTCGPEKTLAHSQRPRSSCSSAGQGDDQYHLESYAYSFRNYSTVYRGIRSCPRRNHLPARNLTGSLERGVS